MNPEDKTTVNITLKIKNKNIVKVENYLNDAFDLISFEHLHDTEIMYKNDSNFKKLVKQSGDLKNQRLDYIMKNNHKYK